MMKIFIIYFSLFNTQAAEIVMKHMPEANNCVICHQPKNPQQLLLRDGTKLAKDQVDLLCGQCHGVKHRRWLEGRHGKVVDSWKVDSRKRLSCVVCHDPHAPKFPKYQAKAPPHVRGH
jgi:hypothetical protein